jgi:hypothetical protein
MLVVAAATLGCVACGGAAERPPRTEAVSDEALRYQGTIRELRAHARASEVTADLERCEAWLAAARTREASAPGSSDGRLYLDATAATLVKVKSYLALKEAEVTEKEGRANLGASRSPRKEESP